MREPFPDRAASFLTDFQIQEIGGDRWTMDLLEKLNAPGGASPVLRAVFEAAAKQLRCRTVVVEPYVSTDFGDEYSAFYSRIFQNVPRLCNRLHFFAGIGDDSRPIALLDLLNLSSEVSAAYRGYAVVRPTSPLLVGDAVLASPHRGGALDLVHCQSRFRVHLLGHELTVQGMPFIEQDAEVGVCADADLWMVARYMHRIGECRRFRPSEMHQLATKGLFHGPAREGKLREQMMDALRRMDLSPEFIWAETPEKTMAVLYSCVESEIPVIVGLPGHVVTVIGHGYHDKMLFADGDKPGSMADCVNAFVAHDDAKGPYRWLPVSIRPAANGFPPRLLLDGQPVDWCIFPEPPRVNLRRGDVISNLGHWLWLFATKLQDFVRDDVDSGRPGTWWTESDLAGLVTREYLRRNDQFKRDIYPSASDSRWGDAGFARRPLEVVLRYWCQRMPKYVWVVELARKSDLNGKSPLERKIVGEVIFDSTAHFRDPIGALLAFHLDDRLLIRTSPGSDVQFEMIGLSMHNAYSPLMRQSEPRP